MNNLEFIKKLTWDEVFSIWRDNEAERENWIRIYKQKGFGSWDEWRKTYIKPIPEVKSKKWRLYQVLSPEKVLPEFRGGPFKGWIDRFYKGEELPKFTKIAEHLEVQNHKGISRMKDNFPQKTSLIGFKTEKGIVILEGMHRCAAVALAAREGENISGDVFIALTEFEKDLPILTPQS